MRFISKSAIKRRLKIEWDIFKQFIPGMIGVAIMVWIFWAYQSLHLDKEPIITGRLSGHLQNLSNNRGRIYFTLDSFNTHYVVVTTDKLNELPANFYGFAQEGDSIFKEKNVDSIYLIKYNKKFSWAARFKKRSLLFP